MVRFKYQGFERGVFMNKKDRLSAFNKNNILDAAKQLFQEKGTDKTTMNVLIAID